MAIAPLERLYGWYGKRVVLAVFAIILALVALGVFFSLQGNEEEAPVTEAKKKSVVVRPVSELAGGTTFNAVGVVTAVSEARLQTEAGGRVTSVSVGIGDRVGAGQILAQIENAQERAALLQAEGAYEAALVGGAQSGISLADARTNAQNAYRTAYTTVDDIIRNLTDELFSNPTTQSVGLRLDGQGQALRLNEERIELGTILENWVANVSAIDTIDIKEALQDAEEDLLQVNTFVSDLSLLLAEQDPNTELTEEVIASYKTRLSAARTRLDGAVQAVTAAEAAVLQAEQSASGSARLTETDARVKQALGTLRAAQAAYEKTLVRSPISGVVNAFYLKANEYVAPSTPAAIVANNSALEIATSIGEQDRDAVAIGDTVTLGEDGTGTVTRIAPAVDPTTGKIEVRIGVADDTALRSGDTTTITFTRAAMAETTEEIAVPIAAFKITATGPVAFTVNQDGVLEARPVVLGAVTGNAVVVKEGLSLDTAIVVDARGLRAGETVDVMTE